MALVRNVIRTQDDVVLRSPFTINGRETTHNTDLVGLRLLLRRFAYQRQMSGFGREGLAIVVVLDVPVVTIGRRRDDDSSKFLGAAVPSRFHVLGPEGLTIRVDDRTDFKSFLWGSLLGLLLFWCCWGSRRLRCTCLRELPFQPRGLFVERALALAAGLELALVLVLAQEARLDGLERLVRLR